MDEAARKYNKNLHNGHLTGRKGEQQGRRNLWLVYGMMHDTGMMTCSDVGNNKEKLERLLPFKSPEKRAPEVRITSRSILLKGIMKLGEEDFRFL